MRGVPPPPSPGNIVLGVREQLQPQATGALLALPCCSPLPVQMDKSRKAASSPSLPMAEIRANRLVGLAIAPFR